MPQESRSRRRSLRYRAFLSCEDPRGVDECSTIRKPKITPTQKEENGKKLESHRRKHKSLSLCSKEMEIEEECESPTSFHLLEVSRGAEKLSNVINSWSNGHSKNNSRDLAQDLLEGALDLGESLAMLSRFQQSPIKKHHKHKIDKAWFHDNDDDDDDLKIEEMDFVEDMKKVIRDGVAKKHVFSTPEAFDPPSISSSQSSFAHSGSNKKTKRPNLIAKLMGLEDSSLRSLPFNPMKQKKTAFDLQHLNSEQRWNGDADKSDDRPPIVILRPSRFSCLDLEQPIIPKSRGEVFEEIFLGINIRTNPLAQTDECDPLKEVKAKEKEKMKSHKKQFVEKKDKEAQKVSDRTRKGVIKGTRKRTKNSGKSEKSSSKTKEKSKCKILIQNGNERYRAVLPDSSRVTEEASQIEITDYVDDDQSSPSETPQIFGNHCSTTDLSAIEGRNVCFEDEKQLYSVCDHLANGNVTVSLDGTTRHTLRTDKLRALLSSSQPFMKYVEEHFDVKASPDSDSFEQISYSIDHTEMSARELVDTATELITLHGSRCSSAYLPRPGKPHKTSSINRCVYYSLEQLLDEVCDEIKALRCCTTAEGDNQSTDSSLLLLVKGDLRSTGMVGGMWHVGWTSAGSADEVQELSREVEELVLDGLIEELFV